MPLSPAPERFFYLSLVAEFLILFLIAAASLPDDPHDTRDLREHYARNRRYFWSLVALFQLSYFANGIYFVGPALRHMPPMMIVALVNNMVLPWVLALLLRSVSSRTLHYLGIGLLLAGMALHYAPYQIN